MSKCQDTSRALYLELRALGLELRAEDHPNDPTDYAIRVRGLRSLSHAHAERVLRRVGENRVGLVHVLLNYGDGDCRAIRSKGRCE